MKGAKEKVIDKEDIENIENRKCRKGRNREKERDRIME